MAQYKVPQDVEADDKLLGPFSFRQFVYLLIAGGLIALTVGLFQLLPVLAIIPIPFALFFLVLALPLKKDQPMETYLAAIVSYYLKPHTRIWEPGQRNATVEIMAPKKVEESRTRDISGEEATHRLSFLANIVDTEGYAIKGQGAGSVREDLVTEADATEDIFETKHFESLESTLARDENARHQEVMREMREAISQSEDLVSDEQPVIRRDSEVAALSVPLAETPSEPLTEERIKPIADVVTRSMAEPMTEAISIESPVEKPVENVSSQNPPKPSIIDLANNSDFSVATIAKEANRLNRKEDDEVFISLH